MPAPKLPKEDVIAMMQRGLSNNQVMDALKGMGIKNFDPAAVRMIRTRARQAGLLSIPRQLADRSKYLPWTIRDADQRHYAPTMLRLLAARDAGVVLEQRDAVALDNWLGRLREADEVVMYDPDMPDPEGRVWHFVPRRPEDGDGPIRRP